jgi:hypothetical protein
MIIICRDILLLFRELSRYKGPGKRWENDIYILEYMLKLGIGHIAVKCFRGMMRAMRDITLGWR